MAEVNMIKRLSHSHIIRVVGAYTHHNIRGTIIYPIAACNLQHIFDHDVGIVSPARDTIYSRIGCIISGIAYLHESKIERKDISPPNRISISC
jgi:hypothetical protein